MSFTVYRSSAGSGKTFTLVREYLKVVLQNPDDFRHILAITFTNKAANEMKERVLRNLKLLSGWTKDSGDKKTGELLQQLKAESGLGETEIVTRSAAVLKKILHQYADFAIGTIDSFSHRIIRTFAHDFGLPVNFTVELDTDELLATAVDLLLDQVGDDRHLTTLLQNFVETRMEEDKDWDIGKILCEFAKNLLDESAQEHLPKITNLSLEDFNRIAHSIHTRIQAFEKRIRELAGEANGLIGHHEITLTAFSYGNNGIGRYFGKLAAGNFDKIKPNSYVVKTVTEGKWTSGKVTVQDKIKIAAIRPALEEAFHSIMKEVDTHYPEQMLLRLLGKSIYPLAVLNEIGKILGEFKKQNNLIHISEFNARIARIVLAEPVPFIYERLGEKFHHLLIDEFQDTSAMQWQNFVPLLENALSMGYFNLVVGDGKQAIYRWRNGDVEQFTFLPELFQSKQNPLVRSRERVLVSHFREKHLNTNYRSGKKIIEFNNGFFTFLSNLLDPPRQRVYMDLVQVPERETEDGYIRIEFLDAGDEGKTFEEINHQKIVEVITGCRNDGYRLKDVAILCRANHEASGIARFLTEQRLPVVSSESLLLIHSPKVRFIIALLQFLSDPSDPILEAELLAFLQRNGRIKDTEFHTLMVKAGSSVDPQKDFCRILMENGIAFRSEVLQALPLYDLCEELFRIFSLNLEPDPYLRFFLEAILKFTSRYPAGVIEFLEWWEKQKEKLSVVIPEGLDAIRIMTIHKAKGLQFPVVIFPFANETLKNTRKYLWVDLADRQVPGLPAAILPSVKEMEETEFADLRKEEEQKSLLDLMNLLYVVMTRPEERLYILTRKPSGQAERKHSLPSFFASFLQEKELWNDERLIYEFGIRITLPFSEEKTEFPTLQFAPVIPGNWRNKIYIRSKAPELWDVKDPERNRRWGNLLHTIFSRIRDYNDPERILSDLQGSGLIDAGNFPGIMEVVIKALNNPLIRPFFEPGLNVRMEGEILLPDGNVLRPDRVITTDDEAVILDYKTGKPNPKHGEQLNIYEKRLRELGFRRIRKYLLYFEPDLRLEKC